MSTLRVSLAFFLLVAVAVSGCTSASTDRSGPKVYTVHAQTARPLSDVTARSFSGTLRAPLESNLSFRISGQVTRISVDVGEQVAAGEVIARLDPEDYRLQLESARASYRQAKAAAENAQAELQRIRSLYVDDNASLSAYDQARTRYETAQNQAEAARRQLELARKRLSYTRLTAPASGSIASQQVQEGENVTTGQPVVRLTAGRKLEVEVQVPENLIAAVETGQPVSVTATSLGSERLPATVTEVASAPNGQRPTYPVVVTLDRPAERLRSGMTARVAFDLDQDGGLVVPAEAIGEDQDGRFAYVVAPGAPDSVSADGHVERRAVETGALTSSGLVVTDGLQQGDRVVTAGLGKLRDGALVRISELLSTR